MNDVFDDLEIQLRRAVRTRRRTRPAWLRRGHRRTSAIVVVATLLISAGALAAGGVIPIGAPAEPHEDSFYSQRSGGIVKGTVRLLGVSTPDPAGGPPWGMRVLSTRRGEGCVQVGRVVDGKIGAIGQDSAFHDDGLFHEFSANTFGAERTCTLLDGKDRLFTNAVVGDITASAWTGSFAQKGCVPSTAGPYERFAEDGKRKPYPVCPPADERNLYYGLLGPYARSVTYVLEGRAHTQATTGPEGAYLIVTRASPTQLFNFNHGGTQDVVPVDGPITELHFRGGATCHLTSRSWIGGSESCSPKLAVPVGWVAPRTPAPTAAEIASPVSVHLIARAGGGHEALLRFTSRVAIRKASSSYTVEFHEAGQPAQIRTYGPPKPPFPAVGQVEEMRLGMGGDGHGLHPGPLTGEVIFQDQTGPGNLEEAGGTITVIVGRFSLNVP
jgi:hypothetical protein